MGARKLILSKGRFITTTTAFVSAIGIFFFAAQNARATYPAFITPEDLRPQVAFWIKMFTEFDSGTQVIFDKENPAIIYDTVTLTRDRARNQRLIQAAVADIRARLTSITNKRFANLTNEEIAFLSKIPRPRTVTKIRGLMDGIRHQPGLSDNFARAISRSGMYLERFKVIFLDHGIPPDIVYLAHVESGFNPAATSKAEAAGIWQFTYPTGRKYLRIDSYVDERRDPVLSTVAAAKYLRYLYRRLQSWPLAISAYNHGPAGIERLVKKYNTRDITLILNHYGGSFRFASRNFYPSFLAAKHVAKNHARYFPNLTFSPPLTYKEIEISGRVFVNELLEAMPILSRADIASLNPSLRPAVFQNTRAIPAGFVLKIPAAAQPHVAARLSDIPGRPHPRFGLHSTPQPTFTWIRVNEGDTLFNIASRYGTTPTQIRVKNNLAAGAEVKAGDLILVPTLDSMISAELTQHAPATKPKKTSPTTVSTAMPDAAAEATALSLAEALDAADETPIMTRAAWINYIETPLLWPHAYLRDGMSRAPDPMPLISLNAPERMWPHLVRFSFLQTRPSPLSTDLEYINALPGETLPQIAHWAGTPLSTLRGLNPDISLESIQAGQVILIPTDHRSALNRQRIRHYEAAANVFFGFHSILMVRPRAVSATIDLDKLALENEAIPPWLIVALNTNLLAFPTLVTDDVWYEPVIESISTEQWLSRHENRKQKSTLPVSHF